MSAADGSQEAYAGHSKGATPGKSRKPGRMDYRQARLYARLLLRQAVTFLTRLLTENISYPTTRGTSCGPVNFSCASISGGADSSSSASSGDVPTITINNRFHASGLITSEPHARKRQISHGGKSIYRREVKKILLQSYHIRCLSATVPHVRQHVWYKSAFALIKKGLTGLALLLSLGTSQVEGNAGLFATDTRLDLSPREGVALINNKVHAAESDFDIDVFNSTNISGSVETNYLTQGTGLKDMAASSNKLYQLIGDKVHEVDEDGNYIANFNASTSSGSNFDAIGHTSVNGTNYIVGINFGNGEVRAYDTLTPSKYVDLATITNNVSGYEGMDVTMSVNGKRIEDVTLQLCAGNYITQWIEGEENIFETVWVQWTSGGFSDIHVYPSTNENKGTFFYVTDGGFAGETGTVIGDFNLLHANFALDNLYAIKEGTNTVVHTDVFKNKDKVESFDLEKLTTNGWEKVNSSPIVASTNNTDQLAFIDSEAVEGSNYQYRVSANYFDGKTNTLPAVSRTAQEFELDFTKAPGIEITLEWGRIDGAGSYYIDHSTNGIDWVEKDQTTNTTYPITPSGTNARLNIYRTRLP